MSKAIREHVRSNVVGYVAIFMFAIGGAAYANHPGGADTISSGDIINDNVNSADVRDDTLPNGGLQAVDLRADSVGSSEVAADAIGSAEIVDLGVEHADLGVNSITGGNVFPSSLSGADIQASSLTTGDIAADTLTSSDIAAGAVGSSEVANGSLGTADFQSLIPAARVTRTGAQNIPRNSVTTLTFNSERYDTIGMHSQTTNLSRLTAPVRGIYAVTAQVRWEGVGSGIRCLDLRRSGAEVVAAQCWDAPTIVDPDQNVSTMVSLAPGDFVEVRALQSCCDTLPILKGSAFSPEFSMTWLAPGP
jgi:hypothetical protein